MRISVFLPVGLIVLGGLTVEAAAQETPAPLSETAIEDVRAHITQQMAALRAAALQVTPAPAPTPRQLAGFSIVLVQGDMAASSATQGIPSGAAKALADLKDFLPYKSYQLLDTQWASSSGTVITLLQRPGQAYRLHITARTEMAGQEVNVQHFAMLEVDGQVIPGETAKLGAQLQAARLQLEQQLSRIDRGDRTPAAEADLMKARQAVLQVEAQLSEAQGSPLAMGQERGVLTSSFRMRLGETVVVGTSRIAGDKALIVLLTAVAK